MVSVRKCFCFLSLPPSILVGENNGIKSGDRHGIGFEPPLVADTFRLS
jgi:hypothetical protein